MKSANPKKATFSARKGPVKARKGRADDNAVVSESDEGEALARHDEREAPTRAEGRDMDEGTDFRSYLQLVADGDEDDSEASGLSPLLIAGGALALGGVVALAAGGGGGNKPPTVTSPLAISTSEDTVVQISLQASDPDGDPLTYTTATNPSKGVLSGGTGGSYTYTPNANANGSDSFTVTVSDGTEQVTATVNVTISAVNDRPTVAATQAVSTNEDVAVQLTVAGSDVDGDALTYTTTQPANGVVTGGGSNGLFTYTPAKDFWGTNTFTVTVSDGVLSSSQVVTVTVAPVIDETVSIDGDGVTTQLENAAGSGFTAGDRFRYTDNSALPTNVVITNFAPGDTIQVTGASSDYNFTAEGDDLLITFNNTVAGVENVIVLQDVGASAGFIEDEATAELVLGFNFFSALTGPGTTGDGIAVANGNLDDDDDGNVQTFAVTSAANGAVAFTEDANLANSVIIQSFSTGDTITVSNAPVSAYSFTAVGNDVVISFLNGGISSEIVLQGVATGVTTLIDSLDDVEALVGTGFFKAAQGGGGGGDPTTATESIDVGILDNPVIKDAGSGSIKYTDLVGVLTEVVIRNFGANDRIQTDAEPGDYSFTTPDDRDLEITFTFQPAGSSTGAIPNKIVLDDVLVGKEIGFIADYASAQAAVGFDFMMFG